MEAGTGHGVLIWWVRMPSGERVVGRASSAKYYTMRRVPREARKGVLDGRADAVRGDGLAGGGNEGSGGRGRVWHMDQG